MCATVSDDDVGKTVEDADGMAVGLVAAVEGEQLYVEPNPGLMDSLKAAIGWESSREDAVPVDESSIRMVTDDAIRLEPTQASEPDADDDGFVDRDEGPATRDVGPTAGEAEATGGAKKGTNDGDAGSERHADSEDTPPHGDRTVTDERGHGEDR